MLSSSQRISYYSGLMVWEIIVMWVLALINYGEPFRIWDFAISSLGATITENGHPNKVSMLFFIISMILAALFMFRIGWIYSSDRNSINRKLYRFLYYLGAAGALIICCPKNYSHPVHSFGAGMLVFSHVAVTTVRVAAQRRSMSKGRFIVHMAAFLVPILMYAYSWAFWIEDFVQVFQKIALASLLIVEKASSRSYYISREIPITSPNQAHKRYTHDRT